MVSNPEVAATLSEIADLLDLLGERFKPEAYRRAARSIEALPESLEAIAARGELRSIPGVGEAISGKVGELLRTGSLAYLDQLRSEVPAGVLELMRIPGLGPKTARRFWTELGISGPSELAAAIAAGRLEGVRGFAEKKIAQLRAATGGEVAAPAPGRRPIEEVWPRAQGLVEALRAVRSVHEVALAGSFRRARETVGDLDVLVTADDPEAVFEAFSRLPEVREVRLRGPTKETVVLDRGLQVDLRVVEPESFGAALQYFTGSKDHNVRLRSLAREHGLKVNEYGVYRDERRVAGRTEEEVYAALGLSWIPPELREDRGEVELAAKGRLPTLVEASDLVAELHVHLSARPAVGDLDRLASSARARGLREVGVVVGIVRGGRRTWTAPSAILERLRAGGPGGVRLAAAVEIDAGPSELDPGALAELGPAYLIGLPPAAPPPARGVPKAPPPVRLVAHGVAPGGAENPALAWARAWGAAVEVGPGAERLDSTAARRARELRVPLAVPTGIGLEPTDPTPALALGFARRAGASRDEVVNARDGPATGPAMGRRTSSARRRS
jgi:DNA polymerase (family X)